MTNLLEKILDSEKLVGNSNNRHIFENIKNDILYLEGYTLLFVKYKFLLDIKNKLIAANNVTDTDISNFDKWKLVKFYDEYKEEYPNKKDFFELKELEEHRSNFIGLHSEEDWSILESSLDNIQKHTKDKDYTRYSELFNKDKLLIIDDRIVKYFLYRKGVLKLMNVDTFLEDYFDSKYFIEPLVSYFSRLLENPAEKHLLFWYWLVYFAQVRIHLYSKNHSIKNISGYSKKPMFKGKIEYNYTELKKKVGELTCKLEEELSVIDKSDWLKSEILDLLCSKQGFNVDISAELNEALTKKSTSNI